MHACLSWCSFSVEMLGPAYLTSPRASRCTDSPIAIVSTCRPMFLSPFFFTLILLFFLLFISPFSFIQFLFYIRRFSCLFFQFVLLVINWYCFKPLKFYMNQLYKIFKSWPFLKTGNIFWAHINIFFSNRRTYLFWWGEQFLTPVYISSNTWIFF